MFLECGRKSFRENFLVEIDEIVLSKSWLVVDHEKNQCGMLERVASEKGVRRAKFLCELSFACLQKFERKNGKTQGKNAKNSEKIRAPGRQRWS